MGNPQPGSRAAASDDVSQICCEDIHSLDLAREPGLDVTFILKHEARSCATGNFSADRTNVELLLDV